MKRCVPCFLAFALVLFVGHSSKADQPAANNLAGQIVSNGKTGRVGIGTGEPAATLDVYRGEVKVGSTGAPCTKANAGALRFADDQLQVCNSYGWRAVAVSAPAK